MNNKKMPTRDLQVCHSDDFLEIVKGGDLTVTHYAKPFGVATIEKPSFDLFIMTYSEFSRGDKKDIARKLKRKPIEVHCGNSYNEENEDKFYFKKC